MSELKIFTGPMYGGKTTRLLSALERYSYQKKRIALFKPSIDQRYSKEKVVTHSGIEWQAFRVPTGESILSNTSPSIEVVAIDEQFMIPGSADAIIELYLEQKKTVLVSSLQLSYEATPFEETQKIMPYATSIDVCPAVCFCGADAFFSYRISDAKNLIEIGGVESYEPRCLKHFKK